MLNNTVRKNIGWAIITIIALIWGASLSYILFIGTHYYTMRSFLLITIGATLLVLAYHIVKIRHKYSCIKFISSPNGVSGKENKKGMNSLIDSLGRLWKDP